MTVSIITPVYNAAKRLSCCLESICSQTFADLQIVLVDDGSTDETPAICEEASRHDARICVVRQDNAGPAAARNAGLDAATGEWIAFVDADDRIEPCYIETLLSLAQSKRADIVASDCMFFEHGITRRFGMTVPNRIYDSREKLWGAFLSDELAWSLWAKLYRAELFDGMRFDAEDYIAEDLDMNARLFMREHVRLATSGCTGYEYHIEECSVDHMFTKRHLRQLEVFERVLCQYRSSGVSCNASIEVFYEERVLNSLRKAIDAGVLEGEIKRVFERAVTLHREEALNSPYASAALKRRLKATKLGLGAFGVLHRIHP